MYDIYSRHLIELIPDLPEIDREACRRALSLVYFYTVRGKMNAGTQAEDIADLDTAKSLLRRMANSLESIAVFDRAYNVTRSVETENACAFVAAESLSLIALSYENTGNLVQDVLTDMAVYTSIEAALLYMIAGYDSNASTVIKDVTLISADSAFSNEILQTRHRNSLFALSRILSLCKGDVRQPREFTSNHLGNQNVPSNYDDLISEIRARFYEMIGNAVDHYLDWLGGYKSPGLVGALALLSTIENSTTTSKYPGYSAFADILHLSRLLAVTIAETKKRSLVDVIPRPIIHKDTALANKFEEYIQYRARGNTRHKGNPFLWPSALEYVEECLPGPNKDAVVSMPTGSGKSFVAELAVVDALCTGWVLYLTPTNALAHQVRRDLSAALSPLSPPVSIRAFVGNEEYTTLAEEQIDITQTNFVAVMTPEKCAIAMRLFPERFAGCSLCIFDECHLLAEQNRGIIADILIAQLSLVAQDIRFLLLSAMVSNADDLAAWLGRMRDGDALPVTLKWRPSRTMRGMVFLNAESAEVNFDKAKAELDHLPSWRKRKKFPVDMALVFGLSSPWSDEGALDYRKTELPIKFIASAARTSATANTKGNYESWKNTAALQLSQMLALANFPTMCFVLSSRHHAFSMANKAIDTMPSLYTDAESLPIIVKSWLQIADMELGVASALRELFNHGVTVHTSALLNVEQAASEWMFLNNNAKLVFATGTLAQGLNLPAIAVVIAGTSMGDPRDHISGSHHVNSLILNAFGRAGRPGFSNQGIAILVTDEPYFAKLGVPSDPKSVLKQYEVLGQSDAAIDIHSPVEKFIGDLISNSLTPTAASENELVLTSLLAETQDADKVLSRTLAAYHKRREFSPQIAKLAQSSIIELKDKFLIQSKAPNWINTAAMKSGVDFFRAWRMLSAYDQQGIIPLESEVSFSLDDWLRTFFQVMALLPPKRIIQYLPDQSVSRSNVLTKMRDSIIDNSEIDTVPWSCPAGWPEFWKELSGVVQKYIHGESYASIAQTYLGLSGDDITENRNSGAEIPSILKFVNETIGTLAVDSGCFLAIQEIVVRPDIKTTYPLIPEELLALPLCIRNGCDSLGSLSWFRFGYRQRICAHTLQRVFPVPRELLNDSARAEWVRQTRRNWLSGKLIPAAEPVLDAIRTVLIEGGVT